MFLYRLQSIFLYFENILRDLPYLCAAAANFVISDESVENQLLLPKRAETCDGCMLFNFCFYFTSLLLFGWTFDDGIAEFIASRYLGLGMCSCLCSA